MLLKISQNFQENTCARVSFFIKLSTPDPRPANLLKKRPWHKCIPVNLAKLLRVIFLLNASWRLLLFFEKTNDPILTKTYKNLVILDRSGSTSFCFIKTLSRQRWRHDMKKYISFGVINDWLGINGYVQNKINHPEAATRCVLQKKLFLKIS